MPWYRIEKIWFQLDKKVLLWQKVLPGQKGRHDNKNNTNFETTSTATSTLTKRLHHNNNNTNLDKKAATISFHLTSGDTRSFSSKLASSYPKHLVCLERQGSFFHFLLKWGFEVFFIQTLERSLFHATTLIIFFLRAKSEDCFQTSWPILAQSSAPCNAKYKTPMINTFRRIP